MIRLLALVFVWLVSCSGPSSSTVLRFVPNNALSGLSRAAPAQDAMSCYFAATNAGPAVTGAPSCVGLSRVSRLATFSEIQAGTVSLRVPLGLSRSIQIWGVGTAGACDGKTSVSELFANGAKPALFVLGETALSFSNPTVSIPSQYAQGQTADRGACEAGAPAVGAHSVTQGLWKGGVSLSISGTDFVTGSTVTIADVACQSTTTVSSTQLDCVTGENKPQKNMTVKVRNPNGVTATSSATYTSFNYYAVLQNDGLSQSTLYLFSQDPTSGALTQEDSESLVATRDPYQVLMHPSGRFVYVVHQAAANEKILGWSINLSTGALTAFTSSTVPDALPRFEMSPAGTFLAGYDGFPTQTAKSYAINSSTGALSPVPQTVAVNLAVPSATQSFNRAGNRLYLSRVGSTPVKWAISNLGQISDVPTTSSAVGISAFAPARTSSLMYTHSTLNQTFYALAEGATNLDIFSSITQTPVVVNILLGSVTTKLTALFAAGVSVADLDGEGKFTAVQSDSFSPSLETPKGAVFDPNAIWLTVVDDGATDPNLVTYDINPTTGRIIQPPAEVNSLGKNIKAIATP